MAYNQTSIYPNGLTTDIAVTNGSINRCYLSEAVMENVKERILTVYQEWFLNLNEGLPWFTEMTGRNITVDRIKSEIARAINSTEGVMKLTSLIIAPIKGNRKLNIQFEYIDIYERSSRGEL